MEIEKEEKQERKRYWIKLEKSFLSSKYIKIIKNMPNGKDYILFYLALMLESVETIGHLRLSELVAYDENTLSALTDTNVDIVRSAIKLFVQLGIINILTDGTIFIPDVPRLTGKESESAERVRKYREKKKLETLQSNIIAVYVEEEKDKQEDKQIKKEIKHKHGEYNHVLLTETEYKKLTELWGEQELSRMIKILDEGIETKGYKYKSHYLAIKKWKDNEKTQNGYWAKPAFRIASDNFVSQNGEINF